MEVGKEYVEVLKSSFKIQSYRNEHSKKNQHFVKKTETSMDKLFYEVIDSKNAKFDDAVVLAQAYLYMSHVRSDNVAVLYESEIHLTKCLELLNGEELNRETILIVIYALNKLTGLAHKLKNNKRSRVLLNYSLQLYLRYTKENEYLDPTYVSSVLGIEYCESKALLKELYRYIVVLLNVIYMVKDDCLDKILLENTAESMKIMQMDVSDDFRKIIKSSSRVMDINPIIECSDRKKKLIGMIEARMDKLFQDVICSTDTKFNDIVVLARAYLYISVCSTKTQKEDLHIYEGRLMKCTELLKGKELDCKTILIAIRAFNELAYIKFKLEEPEKSESLLNNAIRLYEAYTKGADEYPDVIDIAVTLGVEYNENSNKNVFEYSHEISLICLKMLQNKRPLIYEDLWNDLSKWIRAVEETKLTKDVNFEIKEVRKELVEIFKSSYNMINVDSTLDKQKSNFRMIVGKIDKLFSCAINSKGLNFNESIVLAYAYYCVSHIFITKKKEDLYSRRRYMTKCMQLLDGKELDPKAILLSMAALEQLTNIWTKLGHTEKSKLCSYKAMRLYITYTKEIDFPHPINIATAFYLEGESDCKTALNDLYNKILSLFVSFIKNVADAAMYSIIVCMHETLKEKFNILDLLEDSYCNILIAHAIGLYKYFLTHKRLNEAKNHLAVASYILKKFHTERCTKVVQERFPIHKEILYNCYQVNKAHVMRNFAEYGVHLLCISRKKLLRNKQNANEEDDRLCEASSSRVDFPTTSKEQCAELLILFTDVEKEIEQFTGITADKYLRNYNDAKKIFANVLKSLDEAKACCDLKNDVKFYGEILIYTSYAYKCFASYEQDDDKRIKLFKRHIDILESVIVYSSDKYNVMVDKYILLKLGFAYTTVLETKTNSLRITGNAKLSDGRSMDIDKLVRSSMQNFQLFLDSIDG